MQNLYNTFWWNSSLIFSTLEPLIITAKNIKSAHLWGQSTSHPHKGPVMWKAFPCHAVIMYAVLPRYRWYPAKRPYPPWLRMADKALLAGYPRYHELPVNSPLEILPGTLADFFSALKFPLIMLRRWRSIWGSSGIDEGMDAGIDRMIVVKRYKHVFVVKSGYNLYAGFDI